MVDLKIADTIFLTVYYRTEAAGGFTQVDRTYIIESNTSIKNTISKKM